MDILRFITAGNINDGKSTLIGRLLYDTNNIKKDVLESVADAAQETSPINLAFITDGLRTERENGITIDVAYKYFTTAKRKYIITDAPGHFEFTRNLVTGASGVDVMIILIDAKNGITEQTRRHSLVASFLKTGRVVVAVNKMDLVGYDEQVFTTLKNEYLAIAEKLQLPEVTFIPVSALLGDNISFRSAKMGWYSGQTLMQYLESCTPVATDAIVTRFSIQYVIDGEERGYAGKVLSGVIKTGDEVGVYPAGEKTIVKKILHGYDEVTEAKAGENIVLFLDSGMAGKRGDLIACATEGPSCSTQFDATICWLNADAALQVGKPYFLRINGLKTSCVINDILYKTDIHSFEEYTDNRPVDVNQFAKVKIETKDIIPYDPFSVLKENGRGIIIDVETNYTSAAFII